MNIAIIGAGNVGSALARASVRAGHSVVVASRDPQDVAAATSASGARAAGSNAEAAAAADIIILATPFAGATEIAGDIRGQAAGKIVVDVSNRMSFGSDGPVMDTSTSNAEELAELLPESHVVKAFNTLFASIQGAPVAEGIQLDGYVAADDSTARATVLDLVASLGFRPIDVGPLVRARQLEGLAFLNITVNIANGGSWRSGWKLIGAPTPGAEAA